MIAVVWTALSLDLDSKRNNVERAAVHHSESFARALEEHLAQSLQQIDDTLKIMRRRYLRLSDELAFKIWLDDSELFDEPVVQAAVIGPDGFLITSNLSGSNSPRMNLGDREHFRVHRDRESDDLFISTPVVGRVSGKWSIQLTRRIEKADGSFGGVVVVSLDPLYLSRFYSSVDIPNDGHVTIVGADGIVRAASGRSLNLLAEDISGTTLFRNYPKQRAGWFYAASNFQDNGSRLVAYRALAHHPLVVTIGLSTTGLFAEVEAERRTHHLVGAVVTLAILIVMGFSIRGRGLRDTMAPALEHHNRSLTQTRNFLDVVMEHLPIPTVVKDANTLKIVLVNQAYEAFFGRQRGEVIGKTTFDLFSPHDAETITKLDREALRLKSRVVQSEFPVQTLNGPRVVNTGRLIACDENERPVHLITVIADITEKKRAEEQLAYIAQHDPLTGLLNRTQLNERLEQMLAQAERGERLAVFLVDLDNFKNVNDTHGHQVGDELLKAVAARLSRCIRETDFVVRLGGDEFVVIQAEAGDPDSIRALADRILQAAMAPYELGHVQATVGASIGISCAPGDATVAAELLRQADVALYKAKGDGGGTYRFFQPEMDVTAAA
jgi:diguanylate cyclase (GGDEF)-like protein/PAS domain S-box-containing protein